MSSNTQTHTDNQNTTERPTTLSPEEARQGERGNGVWIILAASTILSIVVLMVLFGGAIG